MLQWAFFPNNSNDRAIAIKIGSLEIRWYAIFILTGAILAFLWARHLLKKDNKIRTMYDTFFVFVITISIIGARLWYVLGDLEQFQGKDLWYILNPATGGLAVQGGVMAGILFGAIYFRRKYKEVPFSYHLDTIVPSVLIGQAIGRWGNFMNQEVYGRCVSESKLWFLPKFILNNISSGSGCGIHEVNQPLFLYESILNLIGFILIAIVLRNFWKKYRKPCDLCACYLIWYGLVRLIMEPLRDEEFIMKVGNIPLSILTSILFMVAGIALMIFARFYYKNRTYPNLYVNQYSIKKEQELKLKRQQMIEEKTKEILKQRENITGHFES